MICNDEIVSSVRVWWLTEQIQILLNLLNLLFFNTLLPLTLLPVTCKHVPVHATYLHTAELTKENQDLSEYN